MGKEALFHNLSVGNIKRIKHHQNVKSYEIFLKLLFSLFCFFIGRALIFNEIAPFGLALSSVIYMRRRDGIIYVLAVGAGVLSLGMDIESLRYPIAMLIMLFYGKSGIAKHIRESDLLIALSVFIILIIVNLGYSFLHGMLTYHIIVGLLESVLAFVATYTFACVVGLASDLKKRSLLTDEETICTGIFLALVIAGMWGGEILGISLRKWASVLLTMSAAYIGGGGIGASVGMLVGLTLSLITQEHYGIIANLGICVLVAGTFKSMGKFGSATAFAAVNVLMTFYINRSTAVIIPSLEVFLSGGILMFIPSGIVDHMRKLLGTKLHNLNEQKDYASRMKELTRARLNEVSQLFSELGKALSDNSKLKNKTDSKDLNRIVEMIKRQVCDVCPIYRSCWQRGSEQTYANMIELIKLSERNGKLRKESIPGEIMRSCLKIENITELFNQLHGAYRLNHLWMRKTEEHHNLARDQFVCISDTIKTLAVELDFDIIHNKNLERALISELDRNGIRVKDCIVIESTTENHEVNIIKDNCKLQNGCYKSIEKIVSKILDKHMIARESGYRNKKEDCILRLVEANKYQILTGVSKRSKYPDEACGDSCTSMPVKDGKYMLALSDGMGTGVKAANESSAVIGLLETLLEAGFKVDVSMRTVNSIMMLRSESDLFATADVCVVNLLSGSAIIVKTGAVSSFIKHKDHVKVIKAPNLPIGVLNELNIEEIQIGLADDDIFVMVSDGVLAPEDKTGDPDEWFANILARFDTRNPQELAELLIEEAIRQSNGILSDDMTVMVSRVWTPYRGKTDSRNKRKNAEFEDH